MALLPPSPPPLRAPSIPAFNYNGMAPKATPTASFDPSTVSMDPGFGWALSQGTKALQASAAQRGTLLTGATQKALVDYGQNAASKEYGNAYQRALQTYGANRDTSAQNFQEAQTGYQDNLQSATSAYDRNAAEATRQSDVLNANNANDYQAQLLRYRLQLDQERQQQQNFADNPANGPGRSFSPNDARSPVSPASAASNAALNGVVFGKSISPVVNGEGGGAPLSTGRPANPWQSLQEQEPEQNQQLQQQYAAIVAEQERRQREMDARIREQTARETAAIPPQPKPVPYLPYVGMGRG